MLSRMAAQVPPLAERLLDAQVAWAVDRLTGPTIDELVTRDVDDVLAVAGELRLDAVVDSDEIKRVARRLVATIPASRAAAELVPAATSVVYDGPAEPFLISELVSREHVEAIVDEVLGASPVAQAALDQLAESPLVAMVASRFVGRLVGEVLQANRAVAERVPGLGSLMTFGTAAASRVVGAADKQFEQLIGGTAGKGATFAVRRLNKVIIETMGDPATRAAVMEVWDLYAQQPVGSLAGYVERDDVHGFVAVVHAAVAAGAKSEQVAPIVDGFVDAFFRVYGEYPLTTLLDELEISRDELVADVQSFATTALTAAHESGRLEQLVRDRLAPFYSSPAVIELLSELTTSRSTPREP
jgi:hypothetical protein